MRRRSTEWASETSCLLANGGKIFYRNSQIHLEESTGAHGLISGERSELEVVVGDGVRLATELEGS